MATNFQVKMEYPFPPNTNAQLAWAWNEAIKNLVAEDQNDLNEQFTNCSNELQLVIEHQEELVSKMMESYYDDMCDSNSTYQVMIVHGWKLMMQISNLIRCYASISGLSGETYGLKVLMDFLAGEYDETTI